MQEDIDAAPSAPPLAEIADQVDDQERVDIPPAEVPPQDQVTAAANSSEGVCTNCLY